MVAGFERGEGTVKANKKELLLTSAVCLLPLLAGIILYPRLPETMATHWGFDGTANGWSSRAATVFGLPLFILALHLICFYAESHGTNRNMNPVLRTVMLWICPAMSLLGSALTLGTGLGYEMHISTVVHRGVAGGGGVGLFPWNHPFNPRHMTRRKAPPCAMAAPGIRPS